VGGWSRGGAAEQVLGMLFIKPFLHQHQGIQPPSLYLITFANELLGFLRAENARYFNESQDSAEGAAIIYRQ
jgi:hypothetical protein